MKTKILATVALTTLLGSGLYAANGNNNPENCMKKSGDCQMKMQGQKKMQKSSCQGKMDKKMMHKKHHKKDGHSVMRVFKELNLTPEQITQIRDIKKEVFSKKRPGVEIAFTKDSFDKEKYIATMKQKRDNMLESRAEMLEKTYAILTPKQKEQFKVLLDLQKEKKDAMMDRMQQRGMNFDKNSNGGR